MNRRDFPRLVLLLPILILVVSCASSAPDNSPMTRAGSDPRMAEVYIYRPKSVVGMVLQPTVMLDGEDLLDARNGTVWKGKFTPGKYKFLMDDKESGADLDLQAGQAYFLRVEIVPEVFKGGGRMSQVSAAKGDKDTEKLNPLKPGEVRHPKYKM